MDRDLSRAIPLESFLTLVLNIGISVVPVDSSGIAISSARIIITSSLVNKGFVNETWNRCPSASAPDSMSLDKKDAESNTFTV